MKEFKILILLSVIVISLLIYNKKGDKLHCGDIAFVSYNSKGDDYFSIITLKQLQPHTVIYFTDAEWNGNHFNLGEGNLVWSSGDQTIPSNTEIQFKNIKTSPTTNHGFSIGELRLNANGDAIFAYVGESPKQPSTFIAAVSNDALEFGTLINTKLTAGHTAIIYPKHTYQANFQGDKSATKNNLIEALNDFNNYRLQKKNAAWAIN
ncbi:hypothetical protein [Psychroserpens algicola]|uniref:Uncharacterized protein n=1 Tax=Psychroserpens algicola TaxID=1719034 RepID=A0ABT0HA32_9FLAO|nr:hypothetical protein [Psychroserpens algicola]MCK8481218.1 hypothetical protein [Psychroserpens algicola]